jgi:general stress protein 26
MMTEKNATKPEPEASETVAEHLGKLMKDFRVAMLVTHDTGDLRARPLAVVEVGPQNDIWFATSLTSAKIDELRKHPNVLVTMQGSTSYISVSGSCELSQSRSEIERLWTESWKIWFPKGKEDPDLVLVRVRVTNGEFWDMQGTKGIRFLWEAAKSYFTGEKPESVPEAHGKL